MSTPTPDVTPGPTDRDSSQSSRRGVSTRAALAGPGWPAYVAVLVTAAALVVAGQAGLPAKQQTDSVGAPVQVDRTLVCPGGLPGARAESGTAVAGQRRSGRTSAKALQEDPTSPTRIVTPADKATGAFATQVARTGKWLASTPCPEPRSEWWFVGAGASETHGSRVLIANPREGDAIVDVEVLGPKGPVEGPGLRGLSVPGGSTQVLDLAEVAPATGDLAVHVTTSRGLVSVATTDSYAADVVGDPVREWVAPHPAASRTGVLTGLPARPARATLQVANPGEVEALVELKVIGSQGTFSPQKDATLRVPPGAVVEQPVTELFDGKPLALSIVSEQPVVATVRSELGGDEAYAGNAGPVAAGSALGVPADVKAELRLSSTGAAGTATVAAYDARGKQLASRDVEVAAATTVGLALPAGTRHVVLVATSRDLVGGLVLEAGTGLGSAVFEEAVKAARTPAVRPG